MVDQCCAWSDGEGHRGLVRSLVTIAAVPTDRTQHVVLLIWGAVGALALGWGLLQIAGAIRVIWLPMAFAAGLVFLLEPLVKVFDRLRLPRILGVLAAFLVLLSIIVAVGALVWPTIQQQATELADQLPILYADLLESARQFGERFNIDIEQYLSQQWLEDWLNDPANQEIIQNLLLGFGSQAGVIIRGVTETVAIVVLAPVLAIYILIDLNRFKSQTLDLTPPKYKDEAAYVSGKVGTALGSFVRGQLLVSFMVGVASSIGMWAIDLPFWLLIGILAGILNMIPFLGPVVGGALAAIVALLNADPWQAFWAVVIMIGVQQVDNHIITPVVQRARVNLSPFVIVLALVLGGTLAGLLGVLIAVPVTAAIRIVAGHIWRTRVLGQSWEEASDAMIEVTEPPERLARISRKNPDQTRLFDTQEMRAVDPEEDENDD